MWLAIVAGILCNNIIGMLWYSPLLFMRVFLETVRIDPNAGMSTTVVLGCNVLALMECFGLFFALSTVGASTAFDGLKYGFLIWQFFVFPAMAVHYFFDRRPLKHLAMVAGHHLVNLMVEGAVITLLM